LQPLAPDTWYAALDDFDDANIFQTPAFATATSTSYAPGGETFAVASSAGLVALALVRLFPAPLIGAAVAYVLHGPVWRIRHGDVDPDTFRYAIRLLRDEYVQRRGVTLRIKPRPTLSGPGDYAGLFAEERYIPVHVGVTGRTILMDLGRASQALRKGLEPRWRRHLNQAERGGLSLVEGTDDAMFDLFLPLYHEMLSRKRLAEPSDLKAFMAMQRLLPDLHKMRVFVAVDGSQQCAGVIVSATGRRGDFLFGATGGAGLRNQASYLVHWRAIEWLQSRGCTEYDLQGINPASNPGVYAFKSGLCGKNGQEVEAPPAYDAYASLRGRLAVRAVDLVKAHRPALRALCARYRPSRWRAVP
jgi:hypothetical protein